MKTENTKKGLVGFGVVSLLIFLMVSCSVEHCYNFNLTTTTSFSNGSNSTATRSNTIYCGITRDEAEIMAESMKDSVKSGNYIIVTTVEFNER